MGICRDIGSWAVFALVIGMGGCAKLFMPIDPEQMADVVKAAAADHASACAKADLSGGAGAVAIGQAPSVPVGGYGQGSLVICRSNQPGSVITVNQQSITIQHGIYKQEIEQKELQELRDRLKSYEEAPKILLFPRPFTEEPKPEREKKGGKDA